MATQQLDHFTYLRLPKLDVAGALSLAKILLHRVPAAPPPAIKKAASLVEKAVAELNSKWKEQVGPHARTDVRPIARRIDRAWSSIRDRLVAYESLPEDGEDRIRAMAILEVLFPDGLEFLNLAFVREHAESEKRIELIDDRGLGKQLDVLVGKRFLAELRATQRAYGDALGIKKASAQPAPTVLVSDHLRALMEAISRYALQLLAYASHEPNKREAIVFALAPIDDFRAAVGRRVDADDEEETVANDPPEAELPTGSD
jgi:hypothetical protein